ncbi:hypothetical protein LOTGIDRAFT_236587 [Lottia gigantea]|uniref:Fibronectin type-III domain-containing protein n=1 Tax=Lottia gigantea TaxID=225164 RepID=V3ZLX8_LOTGI|nr:hypothetical protein LOTGIDRAFT_236587 [Lottia gigantea]ESO83420.1 hypothetical protein LOTGIDRAFT_236587 [Lottia gigantea]
MTCNHFINIIYLLCLLLLGQVSCNVGDSCTEGNVTTCGGDPTGTGGYQCDNSNRCQCTADYYDSSGVCTAKSGFNGICNSTTECFGNLTCLSDGNCGCDNNTHYHDGNINCVQKLGINGVCTSTTECLGNLTCSSDTDRKCVCDDTQYHDEGGYGDSCTTENSCNVVNGSCYMTKCSCNENYYTDNNMCKPVAELKPTGVVIEGTPTSKAGYRETCVTPGTDQCGDPNTECVDIGDGNKCYCKEGFYTNNNQCNNAAELKTTIAGLIPKTNTATVTWTLPTNSQFITSISIEVNGIINKSSISNTATSSEITGLQPGTMYSIKVISIVNTDRNPKYEVKSEAVPTTTKQPPGSNCNTSDTQSCTGNLTLESGSNCNPSDTQPCTGNLTCINNKCGCQDDHYLYDNNCYPKLGYNGDCSNSNEVCIPDLICYTATSTCKCNTGYYRFTNQCKPESYKDSNSRCKYKSGEYRSTNQCRPEIYKDSNSRCKYKSGEYRCDNQCKPVSELKPTNFRATGSTATSLTFSWNVPSDTYINEYVISGNSFQDTTIQVSTARTDTVTGLSSGTDYTNIKITTKVRTDRGSTTEDAVSDEITDSTRSDPVKDLIITNINSRNLTVSWFYPDEDMGVLTAYILDVKIGSECIQQYIYVTDINNKILVLLLILISSGNSFQDTTIQVSTARTGTVTGLSSGTDYTNIKITTKVRTDRGSTTEDAVSDEITDSTNPGKPGPLNSDNNYDTTKVMNIGFVKPTGGVDKYIVEITGPGLNTPFTQEPTTNSITVPANTLQSGRQYSISIIAVYNGKNSVEFVGVFNTLSVGSDPVKDLIITNINSRNLTVSWFYPDEDMGVLTAYILDVKIGSECIQQYIYVTDINNKPTTNNCAGVTPTYSVKDLKAGIIQIITDLLPYINYTLIVTPYNNVGPGSVASKSALTLAEAAGEPSNLNVPEINAKSFLVTWNKPSLKTGPTTYYLYLYEQKDLSNNQASLLVKTYAVQGFDTEEYRVNDVVSYWYYRVELQASTAAGNSSIKIISEFQTSSSPPGKVESLTVRHKSEIFTSAEVSWSCIKERNRHGVIMYYTLTSTLVNEDPRDIQPKEICTFTETVRVKPGEDITFTVFATNMDFKGEETVIKYPAPTGKPKLPKEDIILIPNSEVIEQTSFSVTVCPSCLRDETNGPVKITALLVCVKDKCDINDNQLTVAKVRSYANWQKVSAQSFDAPYRVTKDTWYGDKGKDSTSPKCTGLGWYPRNQARNSSCVMHCSVSQPIGTYKTKGDDSISPAVAGIVGALVTFIAMIVGIVIYCIVKRRRSKQKESKEGTVNYTPHSNGTSNPETAAYVNLPNRNSDVETAAYYVNVPDQRHNEEQGPYASSDDDLTPPVYETLK